MITKLETCKSTTSVLSLDSLVNSFGIIEELDESELQDTFGAYQPGNGFSPCYCYAVGGC